MTLLSSAPPAWKNENVGYKGSKTLFDKRLSYQLSQDIEALSRYLNLLKNKQLSENKTSRSTAILQKLQSIHLSLFDYICLINCSEQNPGWTLESDLPIEYQLLFEPFRDDEKAIAEKMTGDWQTKVTKAFALWLNRQLNKKTKSIVNTVHAGYWARIFAYDLRSFIASQEVSV